MSWEWSATTVSAHTCTAPSSTVTRKRCARGRGSLSMSEREYIEDVTHGFAGPRLEGWQLAQRGYIAGFVDLKELQVFIAVMRAESGGYLRAFHNNVARNADGSIQRF